MTAGAYFGSSTIVKAYNKENGILKDLADYNAMAPESEQIGYELGCMFWNSPELYCNQDKLTAENVGGDEGGIIKTMSKITVYPVLNFRLCGKIF